jgi:t-SNARE complex subunit (syntaxin)
MLRRLLGSVRGDVTDELRKLHNQKPHICTPHYIIIIIIVVVVVVVVVANKSRIMSGT